MTTKEIIKSNNIFSNLEISVIFIVGIFLILGNGIVGPTIFGIPLGIVGQIIILPIIFYYAFIAKKITLNIFTILIFILEFWALLSIFYSFESYGLESLRSSTYIIDANYLIVASIIAQNYLKRICFIKILWKIFFIGALYSLTIPFKDILVNISPTFTAFKGYEINILFNDYTTLGLIAIPYFFSENFFPLLKNKNAKLLSYLSIFISLFFYTQRSSYFVFINLFLVAFLLKRKIVKKTLIYLIIAFTVLNLIFLLGFSLEGRVVNISGLNFFYEHFISSFGIDSEKIGGATKGLAVRLVWWTDVISKVFASLKTTIFGLGQGVPLTSFVAEGGILVRDVHNSYIMILGRNGLLGILIFSVLHIKLFENVIYNIKLTAKSKYICNFYRTGLLFIISVMTIAISGSALEVSYMAIPYYFVWGMIGSYKLKKIPELKNNI